MLFRSMFTRVKSVCKLPMCGRVCMRSLRARVRARFLANRVTRVRRSFRSYSLYVGFSRTKAAIK
jgi:hypothetical protein